MTQLQLRRHPPPLKILSLWLHRRLASQNQVKILRGNGIQQQQMKSRLEKELTMENTYTYAQLRDVRSKLKEEECASGTGQRWNTNDAAVRVVRSKLREEECASGMGQRLNRNDAAVRDAQALLREEECA
jgi:hypothetical protein